MTQISEAERLRLLEPPRGKVRAVLDTDTYNEIDDQFAIVQMLLSPNSIELEAIYAAPFHNARSTDAGDGMEQSYHEILRLLQRLNRTPDGFVYRGARQFMGSAKKTVPSEAVADLVQRARAARTDDPLYIVAIGAITNVASALLEAPEIIDRVIVVWLGGARLNWPHTGNSTSGKTLAPRRWCWTAVCRSYSCPAWGSSRIAEYGARDRTER